MKLFEVTIKGESLRRTTYVVCNNLSEIEGLIDKEKTRLGFEPTEEIDFQKTKIIAEYTLILGKEKEPI